MFLFSYIYKALSFICTDSGKSFNTWIKQDFFFFNYSISLVLVGYFVFNI